MKEGWRKSIIVGIVSSLIVQVMMFLLSAVLKIVAGIVGFEYTLDLFQFLQLQFPLWVTLLVVSMIVLTVASFLRLRNPKRRKGFLMFVRRRPNYAEYQGTFVAFGVEWEFLFGSHFFGDPPYGFIESGPLCPECKYEMDAKTKTGLLGGDKKVWHCIRCDNEYDIPKDIEDVRGAVEKLIDAHYRKKEQEQ